MKSFTVAAALSGTALAAEPCCEGKCTKPGEQKYWSIAKSLFGTKHCGECCMDPSKYSLYHFFEANLTKSDQDFPCTHFGYTKYDSTDTHGFGPISMTLDLYDLPKEEVETVPEPSYRGRCKKSGEQTFYAIGNAVAEGPSQCAETCLDPSDSSSHQFHGNAFNKATNGFPCRDHGYEKYHSTDATGSTTVDLYDPTTATGPCCQGKCSKPGEQKYWSIAKSLFGTKHCGECCMDPSKYSLYHFFEANLTKSDQDFPCKAFGYNKYDSTDTHGFGPISMTLDLYDLPKQVDSSPTLVV